MKKALEEECTGVLKDHLIYRSSKDFHSDNIEHAALGQLILWVIQGEKAKKDFPFFEISTILRDSERLVQQCRQLMTIIEKGMDLLENPGLVDLKELESLNKRLFSANSFLKPVIALNDLIFLDKRSAMIESLDSYKEFYLATSKHLEDLLSLLSSFTTGDQKGAER